MKCSQCGHETDIVDFRRALFVCPCNTPSFQRLQFKLKQTLWELLDIKPSQLSRKERLVKEIMDA